MVEYNGIKQPNKSTLFAFIFSVLENGEENCGKLIEAHKQCMRDQGFNI